MSTEVGKTQGAVYSLQAMRNDGRVVRMDSAVPTETYEELSSSEKLAQAPGLNALTRWTGEAPDFERISSAHSAAPGDYDLDGRRLEVARETIGQGLEQFRSFANGFELLLIQHAAYMVGFEGTYNDMYAANQRGELTPSNFRKDLTSPFLDELLAGLLAVQVGLESPHAEIVRDSIVLGAKTVANLNYMSDHPEVASGAQAIVDSANMFPYHYDNADHTARVADALSTMTSAVPSLSTSVNYCAFQLGAGTMVGMR